MRGGIARIAGIAVGIGVLSTLGGACGGDDEDGTDPDAMRFGCRFESRLIDSCNNPEGSPWTEGCVDVLTDDDCTAATMEQSEMVGDCLFTTTYQNVQTTPMMTCPSQETGGPTENEGRPVGETCSSLLDCASGLCVPRFYCTTPCAAAVDCDTDFPGGCCVSEGSLGYCIAADDCAALCPENASPVGLPTVCACDPGFAYNLDFTACEPV